MAEVMADLVWVREPVVYFRFLKLLQNQGLVHGVFTRRGGISGSPYESLNTSYTVGDQQEDVASNLKRINAVIGAENMVFMNQRHGENILILDRNPPPKFDKAPSADALITDQPHIGLMVKQADCQGVIVFDPLKKVVANVHCGWRGNVTNILGKVVEKMKRYFGCKGSHLAAAIGPSLGPCCAEFVTHDKIFPESFQRFMVRENYFDLWAISRLQLMDAGLRGDHVEISRLCTRCRTDLFYSYRREKRTGRFGSVAMLR
ncbi:MAG: peptidoglycan editing factor PgeF [Deltaproteobacteria bacterium]|nr:peptidoglycan editing factor PgeF [Deltaproteobacteria bacterium]